MTTRRARLSLILILVMLVAGASAPTRLDAAQRQRAAGAADESPPYVATFSILGYDPETGMVGGAVQSRVFSVGNGVLWGEANVGMVATQAIVDVSYGPQALELLRQGRSPREVSGYRFRWPRSTGLISVARTVFITPSSPSGARSGR